jgi:hypothetical protein
MLGDPAYDLAIVTRGARRPFKIESGLRRLLDAYASHAPRPMQASEVRMHELCLTAGRYRAALEEYGESEQAAQKRREVERVLGRARAAV